MIGVMSTATLTKPKPAAKPVPPTKLSPADVEPFRLPPEYLSERYKGPMLFKQPPQPPVRTRKRFSLREFEAMGAMGMLPDRVELVDGEIIEMPPITNEHSLPVSDFHRLLLPAWPHPKFIRSQSSHRFENGWVPQPDLTLMETRPVRRAVVDPPPKLVIEIAYTSQGYDLNDKKLRYAHVAVPELWVADAERLLLYVFRDPVASATEAATAWRDERILRAGDVVSPLCLPDLKIEVGQVLSDDS